MTIFRKSLLASTAILVASAVPTVAWGQTAAPAASDDSGITDIIVTAQRREENNQNVPISISAFSAAQLKAQGTTDISRLENIVPGFTFGRSGPDARPGHVGLIENHIGRACPAQSHRFGGRV